MNRFIMLLKFLLLTVFIKNSEAENDLNVNPNVDMKPNIDLLLQNGNFTTSCAEYSGSPCSQLPPFCMFCFSSDCEYGKIDSVVSCRASVPCLIAGKLSKNANINVAMECRFCFQIPISQHYCKAPVLCRSGSAVMTVCTVDRNSKCMGFRTFYKKVECNWCSGYNWIQTLMLSILLGGFGFDRFYLGWWKEGLGKLFSFGGLGIWTILDAILISIGYLGPADGSLYI